jgi:hypothetical protein
LAELVGFDAGRRVGYAEGYRDAQANMQRAMLSVQLAAGFEEEGLE